MAYLQSGVMATMLTATRLSLRGRLGAASRSLVILGMDQSASQHRKPALTSSLMWLPNIR